MTCTCEKILLELHSRARYQPTKLLVSNGTCTYSRVGNILSWRLIIIFFSTVILSLPLIQEGQFSVSGERMHNTGQPLRGLSLSSKRVVRSTFMSKFDNYVKVSILINYKTKQPSNLA